VIIPLKLKYCRPGATLHRQNLDPPEGTRVFNAGSHKPSSSNSGTKYRKKKHDGNGARRKIGLGAIG
jgi:hypothetical protein